jgi:Ankyrin repeats (3 copies)
MLWSLFNVLKGDHINCPTLIWIVPTGGTMNGGHVGSRDVERAAQHRRYRVDFVCQHSFSVVDVDPRFEMDVPISWMVQAAPVLHLSMFAIKDAMSRTTVGSLPFPIAHLSPKEQISIYEAFVNSFLDDTTKQLLYGFESSCIGAEELLSSTIDALLKLTGPAYELIAEHTTKLTHTNWKQKMAPVTNEKGSLMWIKIEYEIDYPKLEDQFILAAKNGNLEKLKGYCLLGLNINTQDSNGATALHWASAYGHFEVVQYLIRGGEVDVEAKTKDGWTALHWASAWGHLEAARCLVRDGNADIEMKSNEGWTALHGASAQGHLVIVEF